MNFDLYLELKQIFCKALPMADITKLTPKAKLREDVGLDSLSLVMLAVSIENHYCIRFDTLPPMTTVEELVCDLENRIKASKTKDTEDTKCEELSQRKAAYEEEEELSPSAVFTAKLVRIITSGLLLLCGIFFALWGLSLPNVTLYIIAGTFILLGAACIFGYFTNDLYRLAFQYDLAFGVFSAILGILCSVSSVKVLPVLHFALCLYVIIDALLKLQIALDAKNFGMTKWVFLVISASLVAATAAVALAMTMLGQSPSVLIGIMVAADGAENMWNTAYTVRVSACRKAIKNKAER